MKNYIILFFALISIASFTSCEKEDPFVDRVVAPVLVVLKSDAGAKTDGFTTDPTVSSSFSIEKTKVGIELYELDKTGILDNKVGIKNIPAPSVPLSLKIRGGNEIAKLTTGADGVAMIEVPWSTLGISAKGKSVSLELSGTYKEVSFTKLFKLSSN